MIVCQKKSILIVDDHPLCREGIKKIIENTSIRHELKSFFEKIKRGELSKSFKNRRRTKDGKILEIWVTATALKDESGQTIEIATTKRDLGWLP